MDTIEKKIGRPEYEPTDENRLCVREMARVGIKQARIAECIGVSEKTLRKHFRYELDNASAEANTEVANKLFELAMGGNVSACIFWAKTRLGWRENIGIEAQLAPLPRIVVERIPESPDDI